MDNEIELSKESAGVSIDSLKQMALTGDWKNIDSSIPLICNIPSYYEWAIGEGLTNQNSDLRDLAVSILEKSTHHLTPEGISTLEQIMDTDENIHVRNRAAFTLFSHGIKTEPVVERLRTALEDEEVAQIAQDYLNSFTENKDNMF